jgi:hypothetical protein
VRRPHAAKARSVLLSRTAKQRKRHGRSRLTNNKDLLPGVDGRSVIYRRFRDIASQVAIDQGGLDQLSEARLQLVRRFSATCVLAEQLEAELANGQEIDVERAYQRLVLNEFASSESQFVDMAAWDACVQPSLTPTLERIPIYVGVDASVKRAITRLGAGLRLSRGGLVVPFGVMQRGEALRGDRVKCFGNVELPRCHIPLFGKLIETLMRFVAADLSIAIF